MLALLGSTALGRASAAQWTAKRPISIVVPYNAGGGADILARFVAAQIGDTLGKQMVVENRPGANGLIAANYVYGMQGDGSTLLFGAADNISIAPQIYKSAARFDPQAFKPVAAVANMVFVLCSRKANKAGSYAEALADLKSRECTYGHWGPGSLPQVGMEMLRKQEKVPKLVAVPYGGAAPVMAALMAGEVDYAFLPIPMLQGSLNVFKLYASGATKRWPVIGDVPTFHEMGIPMNIETWFGYLAPPNTPDEIVDGLGSGIARIIQNADARSRIEEIGYAPSSVTPRQFRSFIQSENKRWRSFLTEHDIKAES
ncbi:Bug family tripartite tricarboxylate transporter substrate binding protein [Cupriavidus sp. 30B13]|uniref:Bug family tripartite tricarboxylate transporter substrate binding protein n=1 Tax=Cupriavidus sp. 30B13 TaxID=3384241 RepID=UPI003B919453